MPYKHAFTTKKVFETALRRATNKRGPTTVYIAATFEPDAMQTEWGFVSLGNTLDEAVRNYESACEVIGYGVNGSKLRTYRLKVEKVKSKRGASLKGFQEP